MRRFRAGDFQDAVSSLRTALAYQPDNPQYRQWYEKAVDSARGAAADGYFRRAMLEDRAGRGDLALSLYLKAAELESRLEHLLTAAGALLARDQLMKAEEYARKAAEKYPKSAQARCRLAEVLLASGQPRAARSEVEKALRLDPRYEEARQLLNRIP